MEKVTLDLIIENEGVELTGRVIYNDNLIVDKALSITELENDIKRLLFEFEGLAIENIEFALIYEI